jgi:hypothetical protein
MAQPTLSRTAQRLYDSMGPLMVLDEDNGWAGAYFCAALCAPLDPIADVVLDGEDGSPGWTVIFDPDNCPAAWLPWLAQFVGVVLPPNLDEAGQRLRIKETDGFKRGTVAAIQGAARQHLTGPDGTGATATVYLNERQGGAYKLGVATLVSETADTAIVEAAIREQKPAGITLTYTTVVGGDYATLKSTHVDYADVKAEFTDYDELRADPSVT